jgi:hypothetical protein
VTGADCFEEIAPPAAAAWETVWLTEHATGILDGNIIDGNGILGNGCAGLVFLRGRTESEHDVDLHHHLAAAVVIFLRLRSALGQRTGRTAVLDRNPPYLQSL